MTAVAAQARADWWARFPPNEDTTRVCSVASGALGGLTVRFCSIDRGTPRTASGRLSARCRAGGSAADTESHPRSPAAIGGRVVAPRLSGRTLRVIRRVPIELDVGVGLETVSLEMGGVAMLSAPGDVTFALASRRLARHGSGSETGARCIGSRRR